MAFVLPWTSDEFEWPAMDSDGTLDPDDPTIPDEGGLPIGTWIRLKSDIDIDNEFNLTPIARKVVQAMKVHGMILYDTGGSANRFTIRSEMTGRWNDKPTNGGGPSTWTYRHHVTSIVNEFRSFTEPGDGLTTNITDLFEVVDPGSIQVSPAPDPFDMQVRS